MTRKNGHLTKLFSLKCSQDPFWRLLTDDLQI